MQVAKWIPLITLCLAGSFAVADDKNCSDLNNPQARQECNKRKAVSEANCSSINDSKARRECAERKQDNSVDCSKLGSQEARKECARKKNN
jgi:hypothetical protein